MVESKDTEVSMTLEEACKSLGFDPNTLKQVITYSAKGLNNSEIAAVVDVSRQTVQRYARVLKNMSKKEFDELLQLVFRGLKIKINFRAEDFPDEPEEE